MKYYGKILLITAIFMAMISSVFSRAKPVTQIPNGIVYNCANFHTEPQGDSPGDSFENDIKESSLDSNVDIIWKEAPAKEDSDGNGTSIGRKLQEKDKSRQTGDPPPGQRAKVTTRVNTEKLPADMASASRQEGASWSRAEPAVKPDLQLFNSTYVLTLPTTETYKQGDIFFFVGHRFQVPVSAGAEDLFGIDGGVIMRLALGYAVTDKLMVTLGRSNREGNWDLRAKYRALSFRNETAPLQISFMGAAAYSQKPIVEPEENINRLQAYGFVIANTLIDKKLGLGITPGYLYNAYPPCACDDKQYSFTMGAYAQYFIDDMWSVIVEANPTVSGWRQYHDSYTFGTELEAGGHFFKFFLGNNVNTNMVHFLSGAPVPLSFDNLHLGFQITRTL
ncbi:MAG: DUF5777 family beta-barrel protein [Bacteroidota bacterium]